MRRIPLITAFALTATAALMPQIHVFHEQPDATAQAYFLALKGSYEHLSGKIDEAQASYRVLSQLMPHDGSLQSTHLKLLFDARNFSALLSHEEKIKKHIKNHPTMGIYLAQTYFVKKKDSDGFALLEELIAAHPENEHVAFTLASMYMNHKRYTDAAQLAHHFLSTSGSIRKAYLFHFLKAKALFLEKKKDEALQAINESLSLHPRFSKGLLLRGLMHDDNGNKENALADYIRYTSLVNDPTLEKKAGMLAFSLGRYDVAQQLMCKNPENSVAYHHDLGLTCFKQKNYSLALTHVEKALSLNKNDPRSQWLYALLCTAQEKHQKALSFLSDAIERNPYNVAAIRMMIRLSDHATPLSEIESYLTKHAKKHRSFPLCFGLGDVLHKQKKFDDARHWYTTALETRALDRKSYTASQILFQAARTWFVQEAFEKATNTLKSALTCKKVYPSCYNLLALLALRNDDLKAAEIYATRARMSNPRNTSFMDTHAMILLKQGKKTKAQALLRKASEHAPHDPTIAIHLTGALAHV